MANPFFSGRIPPGLSDKIDAHLLTTGETRSELLIRLLRAEVNDNKDNDNGNNIVENKNDNVLSVLSDLIERVQKLEEINNKPDNVVAQTSDNKTDNTALSLAVHEDDDKLDNKEEFVTIDNQLDNTDELITSDDKFDNKKELIAADDKPDNKHGIILQEDHIAVELTPTQLTDLTKIYERKKVTKAKSKKLLDLGLIVQIGDDLVLTKQGQIVLAKHQT